MSKILLTAFAALVFSVGAHAQPDIPVDPHSGTPTIAVPLWEVREGEINVPLQLRYDASGVKLADESGWVGLKWGLSGQGAITRVLQGLPDDHRPTPTDNRWGWLWPQNPRNYDGFPTASGCEGAAWNSINELKDGGIDTEPDVFFIDAPGLSGRFMFDNQGIPRPLPFQQLQISYTGQSNGKIVEFRITTNEGTVYTFGNTSGYTGNFIEETTRYVDLTAQNAVVDYMGKEFAYYRKPVSYHSKWHLAKIESASGKKVEYRYIPHTDLNASFPAQLQSQSSTNLYARCNPQASGCEGKSEYIMKTESTKLVLWQILTSSSKIEFTSGETNLNNDPYIYLKNIRVHALDGGGIVREFSLAYQRAHGALPVQDAQPVQDYYNRFFLTSVTEQGDCLKRPPYLFSYHSLTGSTVELPNPGSFQQDFWGYYNGNTASTLAPKLYVYPAMGGADRYRITPMKAGNYTGSQLILDGADRTVDAARIVNGTLSQITYPTGGTLEFVFQPNTYYDAGAGAEVAGGGLRIRAVKALRRTIANNPMQLEPITLKEYTYLNPNNGLPSGKPIALPVFAFPTTFYRPIGTANNRLTYDELQSGAYSETEKWDYLTVRSASDLSNYGLWIHQPVAYEFVTEKLNGNGKTVYEFDVPGTWGQTQSGDWSAVQTYIATKKAGSQPACPTLGFVAPGLYSFPFPYAVNYDFERGKLKKTTVFTETGAPVKETVYGYQRVYGPEGLVNIYGLGFDQIPSYTLTTSYIERRDGVIEERIMEGAGNPIYLYGRYRLLSNVGTVPSSQSETLIDGAGKRLTTTTTYTYEGGLLANVSVLSPDGSRQQTRLRYPKDFSIQENGPASDLDLADEASAMIRRMKEKHMHGTVIERIHSVRLPGRSEVISGASFTTYRPFGSTTKVYPAHMYELKNGKGVALTNFTASGTVNGANGYKLQLGTEYEEVARIPGYDAHDKALALEEPRTQRVKANHFGYSFSLPVAEITDARADAVVFSNFETQTDHGFSVANPVYGAGRTGARALQLAKDQVVYKNGILCGDATAYTLSLWVKAVNAASVTGTLTLTTTNGGGASTQNTYNYNDLGSDWTWVHFKVPVNSIGLNNRFNVELKSSTALLVDDVAFYPAIASLSTYTYTPFIGKTSETNPWGVTRFYEYDALGNLEVQRDDKRNILQHNKYVFYNETGGLRVRIGFDDSKELYDGESITFTAMPYNCQVEGVTYTWDFGDGSAPQPGSAVAHVFPFTGSGKNYRVTVTASHKDFGTFQTTAEVVIQPRPLDVTVCADGPIYYEICDPNNTATIFTGACTSRTVLSGTEHTTYTVSTPSGCATVSYQWQIRTYGQEYALWMDISGATGATLTLTKADSYEVRCVVTACGRTGISSPIAHIAYRSMDCEEGQLQTLN